MKLKIYKVNQVEDDNFFVFAYSWEHALSLVAELTGLHPEEYSQKDVVEMSKEEANEIQIDYNYITDSSNLDTLGDFFKKAKSNLEKSHGVVTDDFVVY